MILAKNLQAQLLREIERLLAHSDTGGQLAPAASREDWERTIAASPQSARELLRELARFADLWRFLRERQEGLGEEVVAEIRALHRLSPRTRLMRLRKINRQLMRRVDSASRGRELRQ